VINASEGSLCFQIFTFVVTYLLNCKWLSLLCYFPMSTEITFVCVLFNINLTIVSVYYMDWVFPDLQQRITHFNISRHCSKIIKKHVSKTKIGLSILIKLFHVIFRQVFIRLSQLKYIYKYNYIYSSCKSRRNHTLD
jgi:uncharacterized membrane protein